MEGIHLSVENQNLRTIFDVCLTYIFIIEMVLKIIGMGISGTFQLKSFPYSFLGYSRDTMNLLDGFVCTVSIFEIVIGFSGNDGGGEL